MISGVKEKIEQIRRGEVPKGYKKTPIGIVPDTWKKVKFSKMFSRLKRKNTEGNSNVLTVSAQYGLINQNKFFNKSIASATQSQYYLLKKGEYVYNKSYSKNYPYGTLKRLNKYDKGIISPLYICFAKTDENKCSDFYEYYFEGGYMNREIHDFAQEGARNHGMLNISIDDFFNSFILAPPVEEQKKIAEILTMQDKVIELQEKKIKELQRFKKACLAMLFPRKGSSVPEKRFDGFSGDWEQRKLSDICMSFEYGLNAPATEYDGRNKYIRITDIDDESRVFLTDDITSPDICLEGMSKYLLSNGDILFARTGASVGKTYMYTEKDGMVYFAGFLIRAKVTQDNDAEFVYQNTLTSNYEKYIRITSQRSGQPGVNAQEYEKYKLLVPSKKEQKQIGNYLRGVDNLITLHQRKLDEMRKMKKSLMQLLLTGIVRV